MSSGTKTLPNLVLVKIIHNTIRHHYRLCPAVDRFKLTQTTDRFDHMITTETSVLLGATDSGHLPKMRLNEFTSTRGKLFKEILKLMIMGLFLTIFFTKRWKFYTICSDFRIFYALKNQKTGKIPKTLMPIGLFNSLWPRDAERQHRSGSTLAQVITWIDVDFSLVKLCGFYSERQWGAGFRSVNPTERWCKNPARALAQGSFALIPHPVARWAKTTP